MVACLAPADLRPEVNLLTGEVRADPRRADLSASDAAALEHALRAGEAWGGAGGGGGGRAGPASMRCCASRWRSAPRPPCGSPWGGPSSGGRRPGRRNRSTGPPLAGDPEALAAALAGALSRLGQPALVVCGDRSAAAGHGAVPALLAHHLGAGQALGPGVVAGRGRTP